MKYNNSEYGKATMTVVFLISVILLLFGLAYLQSVRAPLFLFTEANYLFQPYDIKGVLKGGIYSGIYLFSLAAIVFSLFVKNRILASTLIIYFSIAYGADLLIQSVGSSKNGLSIEFLSMAMMEKTRAYDIWIFKSHILKSLLSAVLFVVFAYLLRHVVFRQIRFNSYYVFTGFLLAVGLSLGATLKIFSVVGQSFPAPVKTLSLLGEYFLEGMDPANRELDASIMPVKDATYRDIVWIIDESIGGQYLSLNGYSKETTPFLDKHSKSPDFHNFGILPSLSNCSSSTNLLLRIGLTSKLKSEFQAYKNTLPTIFQYARRAGFQTHFIDAQVALGQLQNYMTVDELNDIDNFVTYSREIIPNQRDQEAKKTLSSLLAEGERPNRFIVLIKWGAHWPYNLTYPPEKEYFKPAARESYTEMKEENKELLLNAYANSIRFSVDEFLHDILDSILLENKIILYTSDHGQSLFMNEDPLTHCHSEGEEVPIDEYKVPLLIFAKNAALQFGASAKRKYLQEELFATTLNFMGYSDQVTDFYGNTLYDTESLTPLRSYVLDSGKTIDVDFSKN